MTITNDEELKAAQITVADLNTQILRLSDQSHGSVSREALATDRKGELAAIEAAIEEYEHPHKKHPGSKHKDEEKKPTARHKSDHEKRSEDEPRLASTKPEKGAHPDTHPVAKPGIQHGRGADGDTEPNPNFPGEAIGEPRNPGTPRPPLVVTKTQDEDRRAIPSPITTPPPPPDAPTSQNPKGRIWTPEWEKKDKDP